MDDATLARWADLAVGFGANLQPGQILSVGCEPGKEYLTRAVAEAAYRRGARFVDVSWFDPWVKRSRIAHAPEETLDFVPPWLGARMLELGEQRAASIQFSGPVAPGLMDGLDPRRAGRDMLPRIKESGEIVSKQLTNWSILPGPNPAWAQLVYPDLEPDAALARLEEQLAHVLRLDEPDPIAAWEERADTLVANAAKLEARGFDALHYEGPGTDLTVGLLPGVKWIAARMETVGGIPHMANLPTEEVFTSPDPERVDGHVSATMPLVLMDGTVVRDLQMRFEGGRAVQIDASSAAETMRTIVGAAEGNDRLGELALVDDEGRIGKLGTIFYDTLLDENAASHIAIGRGFGFCADDEATRERINVADTHIDFMIGSPELTVTGVTAAGERVPVLVGGRWAI
jgi:aminopeptidase